MKINISQVLNTFKTGDAGVTSTSLTSVGIQEWSQNKESALTDKRCSSDKARAGLVWRRRKMESA